MNIPTNFHESKLKVKRKERKREKDRERMNECDVELHEPDEQFIDTIEIVVGDKSLVSHPFNFLHVSWKLAISYYCCFEWRLI